MKTLCWMSAVAAAACVPAMGGEVQCWEDTLVLPTYGWDDDPCPVFQEYEKSMYYPWTKQDHLLNVKADRAYRALYLENDYLRVTCLPELGGRIYSVLDKTTGEEMFHKNDVIKPALIAMRGAWIAGGIEWNVGPQGHTVFIMEPVNAALEKHPDGSASVVVGATDKTFGTRWEVRLSLAPGRALLDEDIRLMNPTDGVQPYYFWNNTAFPNRKGTRFIYPMTLGSDHEGTSFFTWPEFQGRDITWLKNYDTMTSVFGYKVEFDFFGAYDVDKDRGIVSSANHCQVPGKKAWTWGTDDFGVLSQMSLTDDDREEAPYIEVQSGPLKTQADFGMMRPRQTIAWKECWYPVHGLGDGFEYATRDVAVQVKRDGAALEARLLATGEFPDARCAVLREGKLIAQQDVTLSPRQAAIVSFTKLPEGALTVRVESQAAGVLLDYTTPLPIPKMTPPSLAKIPARADGQPTAEELYEAAFLLDSQSKPDEAREGYLKVLEADPMHTGALWALAVLDNEHGLYKEAEGYARKALERDPENGPAAYQLAVACFRRDRFDDAKKWGWKAARCAGMECAGRNLAGRALMRLGQYSGARQLFQEAAQWAPNDVANRNSLLAALRACGDAGALAEEAAAARAMVPTDPFPVALAALAQPGTMGALAGGAALKALEPLGGDRWHAVFTAAAFLADHQLPGDAFTLLDALANDARLCPAMDPYLLYCIAYYGTIAGCETDAVVAKGLKRAAEAPLTKNFPHGAQALRVLEWAVEKQPNAAMPHYLLGLAYAGSHRVDEAAAQWGKAVETKPDLGQAWRLLGLHRWKAKHDPAGAEACLRKAYKAMPSDQVVLRDLAQVLTDLKRNPEALALLEALPAGTTIRYDIALWAAQAYLDEKNYDKCIEVLHTCTFTNWEGVTTPHDIFNDALIARGKLAAEKGDLEAALADFQEARTYPENLSVGRKYKPTEAEACYWAGKMLHQLGRVEEARAAWKEGAGQVDTVLPKTAFIDVTPAQIEHVKKCAGALEALR